MDKENGFQCQCPEGFKPPYCYSQVDECGSSPCVHGSCRDDINGYDQLQLLSQFKVSLTAILTRRNLTYPPCTGLQVLTCMLQTGFFCVVDYIHVFPVTAVIVSPDGWGRTVTWTGTTVCQAPARTQAHASTSSMVSPASAVKASEVRGCHSRKYTS